jgi:hypothetical protein
MAIIQYEYHQVIPQDWDYFEWLSENKEPL